MTALLSDLMGGAGAPSALATLLGEEIRAVTASGTAQLSRANSIVAGNYLGMGFNTVTTSGGNTAVQLLDSFPVGRWTFVYVDSATSALVYPPSGCSIQGGAADAAITVVQDNPVALIRTSRTRFWGLAAVTSTGGTGTVTSVGSGTGLTGGPITTSGTLALANTAVAAGTYGDATHAPQIVIDAQGRITSASSVAIGGGGLGTVTSVGSGTGLSGGPITASGTLTVDFTPAIVAAAGTVQGDATLIAALENAVTTVASGSGVVLPASSQKFPRTIANHGANTLKIYPNSGGTINGGSANAAVTIAVNQAVRLGTADGTAWWTLS